MNYTTNPITQARAKGITIVESKLLQNLATKSLEQVINEIMEKDKEK